MWLSHCLYRVFCSSSWHTGDSICKNTIPIINYLSDSSTSVNKIRFTGADPGFKVRGVKIFWVFHVENHDFMTKKKSYFFQF